MLSPGALDGLNGEARAILLGMVNTGYRPSEADLPFQDTMARAFQLVLDGLVFSFDRMIHVCLRRRDIALYVKGETGTDVAFHKRKTGQMRDLFVLGAGALGLDRAFRLRLERVTVQQ